MSLSITERNATLLAMVRERKSGKEIAAALNLSPSYVNCLVSSARMWLGAEAVPYHYLSSPDSASTGERAPRGRKRLHDDDYWREVARLWREGKTGSEVAAVMGVPALSGNALVQQARRYLGLKLVPKIGPQRQTDRWEIMRKARETARAKNPLTIGDLGRYYVRRIGPEYILRNAEGQEEVWTIDPTGFKWSTVKLRFKEMLGPLAARAASANGEKTLLPTPPIGVVNSQS